MFCLCDTFSVSAGSKVCSSHSPECRSIYLSRCFWQRKRLLLPQQDTITSGHCEEEEWRHLNTTGNYVDEHWRENAIHIEDYRIETKKLLSCYLQEYACMRRESFAVSDIVTFVFPRAYTSNDWNCWSRDALSSDVILFRFFFWYDRLPAMQEFLCQYKQSTETNMQWVVTNKPE